MIRLSDMSPEVCTGKINACIIGTFSFTGEKLMFAPRTGLGSGFHPLDFGLQVLSSSVELGFRIPAALYSGFQSLGFWIPQAKISWIPKSGLPYIHAWGNDVKRRLHRSHVCTINPLDKTSDLCIAKI